MYKKNISKILVVLSIFVLSCTDTGNIDSSNQITAERVAELKERSSDILSGEDFNNFENSMAAMMLALVTELHYNKHFRERINTFIQYSKESEKKHKKVDEKDLKRFGISDATISIFLSESQKIEKSIENINTKYLGDLKPNEKGILGENFASGIGSLNVLTQKAKATFDSESESDACCPGSTCCKPYRDALKECLRDAGYDWWILMNSGIAALWTNIAAYERAKRCIDKAEAEYSPCCRKK